MTIHASFMIIFILKRHRKRVLSVYLVLRKNYIIITFA